MNPPSVSVIIPSYNTASFIAETLDSVFAQTFMDCEVIVVNDGSPDTLQLERVLEPYRDRIVYLKQENQGPSGARNTAIRHARGIFLAFLDSDDMWLPQFLSEQMKFFQNAPSLDLVYADTFIFRDMLPIGTLVMKPPVPRGQVSFNNILTRQCQVVMSCTVVRKQVVIDSGLFDESLRRVEDYDLWLRIAYRGGEMMRHQKILGLHRIHSASLSADEQRMIEDWICVLNRFPGSVNLRTHEREVVEKTILEAQAELELIKGKQYVLDGDVQQAKASFEKAYEFFQRKKLQAVLLGLRTVPWLVRPMVKCQQWLSFGVDLVKAAKAKHLHWVSNRRHLYSTHFRNAR